MNKHYYLIHIQFLGFRYHGWLKQPKVKTVQSMIEKTITFILGNDDFKTMGCSRTDSKVSANQFAFELFTKIKMPDNFFEEFNQNLPGDIKALKIEEVDKKFSIINNPKVKEYLYLFSFGEKAHPFSAPLMHICQDTLDIEMMKDGAILYKGIHNLKKYCTKPKPGTNFVREILECEIVQNDIFKANFFPETSFLMRIHAKGFLRYQVRLIMGQLLSLGRGEINLNDIKRSLMGDDDEPLRYIAPPSGLILNKVKFDI